MLPKLRYINYAMKH